MILSSTDIQITYCTDWYHITIFSQLPWQALRPTLCPLLLRGSKHCMHKQFSYIKHEKPRVGRSTTNFRHIFQARLRRKLAITLTILRINKYKLTKYTHNSWVWWHWWVETKATISKNKLKNLSFFFVKVMVTCEFGSATAGMTPQSEQYVSVRPHNTLACLNHILLLNVTTSEKKSPQK